MLCAPTNRILNVSISHSRIFSFEVISGFTVRTDGEPGLLAKLKIVVKHEHATEEFIPLQADDAKGIAFACDTVSVL